MSKTTSHLLRSKPSLQTSKYFSPPPPRSTEPSWPHGAPYSRFSITPASIASFSLTHLTDSDMEQGGEQGAEPGQGRLPRSGVLSRCWQTRLFESLRRAHSLGSVLRSPGPHFRAPSLPCWARWPWGCSATFLLLFPFVLSAPNPHPSFSPPERSSSSESSCSEEHLALTSGLNPNAFGPLPWEC